MIINKILSVILGFKVSKISTIKNSNAYYNSIINGAKKLYSILLHKDDIYFNDRIAGMIFSKDRPLQLHALLTSYFKYVKNSSPVKVLYSTTNIEIESFYKQLMTEFIRFPVLFIREVNFHDQVLCWMREAEADRIFFMTDDATIIEEFDLNDCLKYNPVDHIFAFRFGKDLTYCFPFDTYQDTPLIFRDTSQKKVLYEWYWNENINSPDWTYPLSVDGHVFYKNELIVICENIAFNSPNSLEMNMQVFIDFFLNRKGVCYSKVKFLNIPCNIVQNQVKNRSTNYYSIEELLIIWKENKRINIDEFYALPANEAVFKKFTFI